MVWLFSGASVLDGANRNRHVSAARQADLRSGVLKVSAHLRLSLSPARIDELLPKFSFEWMRANEVRARCHSLSLVLPY